MLNGQKTKKDSKQVWLDLNFLTPRVNDRRKKLLDKIWIDNVVEINKQIRDMTVAEIADLLILFQCSINQLASVIKVFKEKTKF